MCSVDGAAHLRRNVPRHIKHVQLKTVKPKLDAAGRCEVLVSDVRHAHRLSLKGFFIQKKFLTAAQCLRTNITTESP